MCLALIFAIRKLLHYLQHHHTKLISIADLLKYILNRPTFNGRLAKCTILLQQYDIEYVTPKEIKGQALIEFLAAHAVSDCSSLAIDLRTKEVMLVAPRNMGDLLWSRFKKRNNSTKRRHIG